MRIKRIIIIVIILKSSSQIIEADPGILEGDYQNLRETSGTIGLFPLTKPVKIKKCRPLEDHRLVCRI